MLQLREIQPSSPPKPRVVRKDDTVVPLIPTLAPPRRHRILDFDSEQMPNAYLGSDLTTRTLTAIAWAWTDKPSKIHCELLHRKKDFTYWHTRMLTRFVEAWDAADIVTGHNIRRHDIPIINASLVYYGLGQLKPKRTSDTLMGAPKSGLVFSRSQENMGMMLGTKTPKYHMNNYLWQQANTLEPRQVELTRERCVEDVRQHMEFRQLMIEEDILKPVRWWRP